MSDDIPPEITMKDFAVRGFRNSCVRFSYHYTEIDKVSPKEAHDRANRIYGAMLEPWKSLPDKESAPAKTLHVAKNAAVRYMNRQDVGNMSDVDGVVQRQREISEAARSIYDDIVELGTSPP